jgi:5-methylthioribose kinase
MTVTAAKILTAESIPKYLEEHFNEMKDVIGDSNDSLEGVQVATIAGGNVNYAFCITLKNGKTMFLKQAPEFVAIFGPEGFPLTSERMQTYLPEIYYFDSEYFENETE